MHSPLPWKIRPDYGKENVYRLWNADDNYHDDTSPEVMDANAELMMKATRSHEAMKAALKLAAMRIGCGCTTLPCALCRHAEETIDKAIILAEGKE